MVERFCDTHFERFGRREHSLLRVFHKLFGLLGDRLDLIACVLCRKFHKLGGRLHSVQPLHKVKRGVGVCVSELRGAVRLDDAFDAAAAFEELFERNGWPRFCLIVRILADVIFSQGAREVSPRSKSL